MGELINKSYKQNKWFVWISFAIILLSFVLLFTNHARSQNETSRYIKLNGKTWEIDKDPKPEWFTNQQEMVTFTIDLKEDYQNYLSSIEKPDDEGTEGPAPAPGDDGTEDPAPPPASAPADVAQPFTIGATYDGKAANTIKVSKINEDAIFKGEYKVEVSLPSQKDGRLDVTVDFSENTWGFSGKPASFSIERDTVKPKLKLSGINKSLYTDQVELNLLVTEKNYLHEDVTVLVVTDDEEGQGQPAEISWDEKNANKGTVPFTDSGKYSVTAFLVDKAGNESDKESVTFTIDKGDPKMSGVEKDGLYNRDVAIMFEDDGRITKAVATLVRTYNGERFEQEIDFTPKHLSWRLNRKAELTLKEEGSYEGTVTITDNQGQEFSYQLSFMIDKTAPVISVTGVEHQQKYNEKKAVEINMTEDLKLNPEASEVSLQKKSIGGKLENQSLSLDYSEDGKTATVKQEVEDGIYELTILASDSAGNKTKKTVQFTIDRQKPELEVLIDGKAVTDQKHYASGQLSVKVTDLTLDINKTTLTINSKKVPLIVDKSGTNAVLKQDMILADDDYQLSLSSADGLENGESLGPLTFVVDTGAPEVALTGIEPGAFVKNGTLTIHVKEKNYQTNLVTYKVEKRNDDGQYAAYQDERFANWENTAENSTLALPFGTNETADSRYDGEYRVTVTAKDAAGHEVEQTVQFTIDATAPVVATELSSEFNKGHYAQSGTVSIIVDEPQENFETNDVRIDIKKKDGTLFKPAEGISGTWTQSPTRAVYRIVFTKDAVDNEGDYLVTVDAKDKAGNAAEQKSIGFTIDHSAPVLAIDPEFSDKVYFNKNTSFNFKITDPNIDLTGNELTVLKDGSVFSKVGNIKLQAGSSDTGVGAYTFNEDGDYSVTLASTDKAGNKGAKVVRDFIIDQTAPKLTISGVDINPNNHHYYPEPKQIRIAVEDRNFALADIDLKVTKDGVTVPMGEWNTGYEFTKTGRVLVKALLAKTLSGDGDYTISLSLKDKAGNRSTIPPFGFTIDQTKPTIEIQGVEQDAYYNTDKQMDVTIKDKNLKLNTIQVTRDGSSYNAGSFRVNGDTAVLSHLFSKEGIYEVLVEAVDQAGNSFSRKVKFTIDKTAPVITAKFKGENRVIQDGEFINKIFTPQFVLDQPEDSIVSVTLNGGANINGHIPIAAIETKYSYHIAAKDKAGNEATLDISFTLDTTRPELTISGIGDGFFNMNLTPWVRYSDKNLDESHSTVTLNGGEFKNRQELENERDYVLKANIFDKAKNVNAQTVVFTIDKTAPKITFKEPISSQYFNKSIIPGLIIEDLSDYDIISLTLNGEPYTIGTPIETDGKHVLFIEAKDKAGNIQQMSVEFIIDRTPPKAIFEGVKEKKKYYEAVKVGIRLDNPEDTIKSITVNGESFTGDAVTRDGFQVIKTTLKEIKPYEIKVLAADQAGNESTSTLSFEIAEKSALVKYYENKPLFAGSIAGIALLLTAGGAVIVRRRKSVE
ncbi:Ig-like domain-containing protein [Neobacillus vireti]|uniref:Ig-like domain-containing protein n=1 Tax=Neobacillus vireti LMG 21834 TaxID=1131730 RepID=A0AB94IRB8_9BACI|nr:Ig-like domain-containing protein [Neobacillus vireti]ETI69508.1 hypothetical protein BAVI_07134 [Neobacillus vireti LMG 21834]KLT18233.1 hypothetical protein AA980_07785 [Neobacillus vireti]